MRSVPWWALVSSAAAPVVLIGGWTLAARQQPDGFDSTVRTISELAARDTPGRWLMTVALLGVGLCHVATALGLSRAATAGRLTLALGGVATMLVAVFPLPAAGPAPAHAASAAVAFAALAVWPALGRHRRHRPGRPAEAGKTAGTAEHGAGPAALRPAVSFAATLVLLGLVGWFAVALSAGSRVGLAERVAAGAQACWPLVVVLSVRRHAAEAVFRMRRT